MYTGEAQYPELSITYEGETLVRGVNYEFSEVVKPTTGTADDQGTPADPIEVGSYRVKLVGKESGGYTGWFWEYFSIVAPGRYYISVLNAANGYSGARHRAAEFYIYDPNTTVEGDLTTEVDSEAGVAVAGTLFDEMNVDGNEVRVSVEDVALSNPTRSADLERQYKDEDAEFFKVIDVNLDLLNSEGDVIAPLTEQLNKLNLTFPVDEALNGRTAMIVQLHKNAATGATEEIRMTVPVVDGGVTVTVDQLFEFVVSVEAEGGATLGAGTKPAATDTTTVEGETPTTRPASALPNTGDDLALPGMLFVAALAAGASIVALRRETNR